MSATFQKIKNDLPNFPEEVIRDWLEPFGKKYGWPPAGDDWRGVLFGKSFEFWKTVKWNKKNLDLTKLVYSSDTMYINDQTEKAYVRKEKNFFSTMTSGENRHLAAFHYLAKNGKFPKPICLLNENDVYSVVDGNHRFLAWTTHQKIMHAHNNAILPEHKEMIRGFNKTLKEKWGIDDLKDFSPSQEVWIAVANAS